MGNGDSIYCIYYLHFSSLHSRAVNGSVIYHYTPSLLFEVRCESGI